MSEFEAVTYRCDKQVAVITLNRPSVRNSLNSQLRLELAQAIKQANTDNDVRVVIIAGAGKGFCAGADLGEKKPGSDGDGFVTELLRNEYNPIIKGIIYADKPFISLVNGAAAGIGAAIAMACDLMMMADDAFLYSAFGAISLIPDGGSHKFLLSALGAKKAYEMIAFSQRLPAAQCLELGMVNTVVAADNLLDEGVQWAHQLAQQAPLTLKLSKQVLREAATADIDQVLEREAQLQNIAIRSDDFKEGSKAFFEKRPAVFKGQ
ncbi:MAG: enoyl-CoA hydratase/isomerase family protein [Spongiibacteraceae bacterium]|nr:enoyl-CoA hydratase/isomerase family protein [Spongiibacteraceae bacterium]